MRINWILTADCWGMDVWRELEVLWCPWSDHWGVIGQGTFGGSGDGPGHWRLNCALLKDKGLWEQWEVEVSDNIAGWRREGVVAGDRWLKLKAAAQVYWGEVGRAKGRLRRKQMKEVSRRLEGLLLASAGRQGGTVEEEEEWRMERVRMEIEELKAAVREGEERQVQGMIVRLRWQGLEEGERPTKFLPRLLRARKMRQRWEGIIGEDGVMVAGL